MENIEHKFIRDLRQNDHIYIDIRDRIGFAFYYEGKVKDFYEKERKIYINQDTLHMELGFCSLKLPWELLSYQNGIYSLIHGDFRLSILFIDEKSPDF